MDGQRLVYQFAEVPKNIVEIDCGEDSPKKNQRPRARPSYTLPLVDSNHQLPPVPPLIHPMGAGIPLPNSTMNTVADQLPHPVTVISSIHRSPTTDSSRPLGGLLNDQPSGGRQSDSGTPEGGSENDDDDDTNQKPLTIVV